MPKRILVSVDPFEARAALLDGDSLVNVELESAASNKRKGNVYRGKVTAVEPSIDAAFVDYGAAKDGFLPFDEVSSKSLAHLTGHGRAASRSGLKTGDWVLVQVTKEEVGKKGASLTMHVSLPGRFVVLMPFSDRTGISRKLGGEERARLRSLAQQLQIPEGYGCIVRTVGEDERLEDLQADLDQQIAAWESILSNYQEKKGTGEVHVESGLALRFVRDYMTSDVAEVVVEDETSHRELAQFLEARMPQRRSILKRYSGDMPLFLRHGVERQIEALLNNKVGLPSGGSIVIGQTEALVAIDVNSGRMKQKDIEDTAFKVNLEAAREIARQVILRDLGGIIVVDFIDMESEAHNHAVEEELKAAFRWDKARLTFTRIQEFGLLSFSRQRLRQAVDSGITLPCPTCTGSGRVRSPNLLAMSALRKIRERLATQGGRAAFVEVTVPVEVGNFLNNRKREALTALERKFDVLIDVLGDPDALPDDLKLTVLGEVPQGRKSILGYEETEETAEGTAAETHEPEAPREAGLPQRPAHAPLTPPPSAGKGRSLFRGLISKFLGLEELGEVPPPSPEPARRDFAPVLAPVPASAQRVEPPREGLPPRATAPSRTPAPQRAPAPPRTPAPQRAPAPQRPPASSPQPQGPSPAPASSRPQAQPKQPATDRPVPPPGPEPRRPAPAPVAVAQPASIHEDVQSGALRPDLDFEGPGEGGEGTARKRRRRRRRRGHGGAGEGAESLPMDTGDQALDEARPADGESAPAQLDAFAAVPDAARTRRPAEPRRREPAKTEMTVATATEASETEEAPGDEGEGSEGIETASQKRRRRRRRSKGGAGDAGPQVDGMTRPTEGTPARTALPREVGARGSGTSRPEEPPKTEAARPEVPTPEASMPEAIPPEPPVVAPARVRTPRAPARASRPAAGKADEAAPPPTDGEAESKKRPRHRGGRGRKKADGTEGAGTTTPDAPRTPAPDGGEKK